MEAPDDPPPALRGAARLIEIVGGLGVLALMLLTVGDALLRTFANRPILGANDLTQVTLAVVVAISLPLCVLAGRAVTIDVLLDRLPSRAADGVRRVAAALSAAILALVAWRCAVNAAEAAAFGETTMLLQISYGPFYAVLALAFALTAGLFAWFALRPGRR